MNASKILQQLMSQASGSKGSSGGMDVKGSKQRFQRF